MIETRYLIIGNSAGGIGAAEAIREVDRTGKLTIVSDEPYPAYSRPLISKYLASGAEVSVESIYYRPADFYQKNGITFLRGRRVDVLDVSQRRAVLDGGDVVHWEKVLMAVGGRPIVPKIRGIRKKGVFYFVTFDDARNIESALIEGGRKAVVIGGGLIGVSVTEALTKRGVKVTLVEMKDRVLNTILDSTGSQLIEAVLRNAGVEVLCGRTVVEIVGRPVRTGQVGGVVLDDGIHVACDMVVVAIGVTPRLELATGTSIAVNHGVLVDRYMATSVPGVYACGDVAEAYDFVYGLRRLVPVWPAAYIGGRVAGYNMAGCNVQFDGVTAMNSLSYFGTPVISAGMVTVPEGHDYEVISRLNGTRYRRIVLNNNRIVGLAFVRDVERAGVFWGLMKDRIDVSSFKSALDDDSFSTAALPASLRTKRNDLCGWNLFHTTSQVEGSK